MAGNLRCSFLIRAGGSERLSGAAAIEPSILIFFKGPASGPNFFFEFLLGVVRCRGFFTGKAAVERSVGRRRLVGWLLE